MKKKALAMLLIFSMFVSIFSPMTVAFAADGFQEDAGTTVPDPSFSGAVLSYETGKGTGSNSAVDVITITFSLQNTEGFNALSTCIGFDSTVVKLCKPDGANGNATSATEWLELPYTVLDEDNEFAYSNLSDLCNMKGNQGSNTTRYNTVYGTLDNTKAGLANAPGFTNKDGTLVMDLANGVPNELVPIFKMTFKLQTGKTLDDIKANTFYLSGDDTTWCPGGTGLALKFLADNVKGSDNCYWQGFPGKEASTPTYKATVKVQDSADSAAISGATVEISGGGLTAASTKTTGSDGTVEFTDLADGTYNCKVTHNDYTTVNNSFTVSGVDKTHTVTMTKKPAATYSAKFTVQENGTNTNLSGASITVYKDGTAQGSPVSTDGTGKATVTGLTAGNYTYEISKSGYQSANGNFSITSSDYTVSTVKLTKSAAPTYPGSIVVNGDGNAPLEGAIVTVKQGNVTVGTFTTDSTGTANFNLEAGNYTFTVSKPGYVMVSGGNIAVGSGGSMNITDANGSTIDASNPITMPSIPVTGNPVYYVKGEDKGSDKYEVKVYLANVVAYQGSFGLHFDDTIFSLDSFTLASELQEFVADSQSFTQNEANYHTVYWQTKGTGSDAKFDGTASADGKLVATYVFNRIARPTDATDLSKLIDNESFVLQDFSDTTVGGTLSSDADKLAEVWENDKYKVGYYDASSGKAVLGPVDTEITYDEQRYARMNFKAMEGTESGGVVTPGTTPVPDAVVTIYQADGTTVKGTSATNAQGYARVSVEANNAYKYIIEDSVHDSYWPAPGGYNDPTLKGDITSTDITNDQGSGKTKDITEGMIAKEKHDVTWDLTGEGTINGIVKSPDDSGVTAKATLNADYAFSVTPRAGREVDGAPQYTVTPASGSPIGPNSATWDPTKNKWIIPGSDVTGTIAITVNFKDATYTVTATAGAGGKVAEMDGSTPVGTPDATKTQTGIAAHADSHEFVFTPDSGYVIDRIAINGSLLPDTNGKTTYSYTFTDVVRDGNIVVTFCPEPANPGDPTTSTHNIFTFNSGINGTIEVTVTGTAAQTFTVGEGEQEVVILPIGDNVSAEVKGNTGTPGFVIDELVFDGAVNAGAAGNATYTVTQSIDNDSHNLSATFKANTPGAPTLQYHVVTAIAGGNGTIVPLGDTLYDAGSVFDIVITPDTYWSIEDVEIDGTSQGAQTGTYTHSITDLRQDVTVIVTFGAKLQSVNGYVKIDSDSLNATGAWVEFTRTVDGRVETYTLLDNTHTQKKSENPGVVVGDSTKTDGYSSFSINLPIGTYTMTVHKEGYVDYVITDFEVVDNQNIAIDKAIPIVAGDASWDRIRVSLLDAATISGGFAGDGSLATQANIGERTAGPGVDDMLFVKQHYGDKKTEISWADYKLLPADNPNVSH